MNSIRKKLCIVSLLAVTLFAVTSQAQLTLDPGGVYSENFNDLAGGLSEGWSVQTGATANALGTAGGLAGSGTWSSGTGQFAHYASTIGNGGTVFGGTESTTIQNACTNRALGLRQTASFGNPGGAFVLQIANTLGFTNFQLSLDFVMLSVQTASTTWTLDYAVGNTPTSFTPLATYSDPGAFGATHTNLSFNGGLDNQSENIWIRVVALSASTGSGSRDTFGIDNVVLTYTAGTAVTNPPTITSQPQSRTNAAGSTATFSVAVSGTQPFTYQWKKNGSDVVSPNASGVNGLTLSLTNVTTLDNGIYSCFITNAGGFTNTIDATLTVIDPSINSQPNASSNLLGERQTFSVSATGTAPLTFQWLKNGTNITDATNSTVVIANVSPADVASYSAIVTNGFGTTATSSVAPLTLLTTPSVQIAQWDFNDTNILVTSPPPTIGTGTASLIGGATAIFVSGVTQDPRPTGTNADWDLGTFPAATAGNKTAGAQFAFSTVGYQDVLLSWHEMHTLTASRYTRMQYSTDGVNFTDLTLITRTNTSFDRQLVDLSSIPGVNDNPNFAFRIVTEFESTAIGSLNSNYVACGTSSTYSGSGGKVHIDWLNVFANPLGTATPIPLNYQINGNNIILSWSNPSFALQAAPVVTGAYTNVGIGSPYTNSLTDGQKYFRLRAP